MPKKICCLSRKAKIINHFCSLVKRKFFRMTIGQKRLLKWRGLFFFSIVCSVLIFCPHTVDLIDMRQEKRDSDNHLFFLLKIV